MSKTVFWKRLMLKGFGRYRGEVEVTFATGLNNGVAPNEQGKSTLVAGLVAVLFGLPNTTDPTRFGKARYRNWDEPEQFMGEVEFSVDGVSYRVRRDFTTDRVSLARWQGDHWEQLAGGEHRAYARRRNVTYEETLANLIGIGSADLFWSTFCVGQPLPEPGQLSESVQELISGTGVAGKQALERLETWLEAKTRYTGRLGVSTRDKNKDRELENLEEEKTRLEQAVRDSAACVDELNTLKRQIAELEGEKRKVEESLEEKDALYQDWNRWRNLRERYSLALGEQRKLNGALEQARNLNAELNRITDEIVQLYPEFVTAPPDVAEGLENLARAEEECEKLKDRIEQIQEKINQYENEVKKLEGQLMGPLAAGVGRPHLLRDYRELLKTLKEQQELEESLDEIARQEDQAQRTLAELHVWDSLGDKPLAFYEQSARVALGKYRELQSLLQQLREKKKELNERYSVFQEGSPQLGAVCRDYHTEKTKLEQQLRDAEAAYREAEKQLADYQKKKASMEQQFSDLAGIPSEIIPALNTKLDLEKEKRALEEKTQFKRAKATSRACRIAGVALLVSGAVSWALSLPLAFVLVPVIAGLAVGIYGYISGRSTALAAWERELARVRAELAAVDARTAPYSPQSLHELAVLCERLKLRESSQQELAALYDALPTPAEVAELEKNAKQAKEALEVFNQEVAPVLLFFADPQKAYYDWQNLKQTVEELKECASSFAQREFGAEPDQVDGLGLANVEGWKDIGLLASIAGEKLKTVGEAAEWLASLPGERWLEWEAEAARYQEAKEELRSLGIRRAEVDKVDAQGRHRREVLADSIASLREAIAPFTEATPEEELAELVETCEQVQKDLGSKQAVVETELQNLKAETEKLQQLQARCQDLAAQLEAVLTPAGGIVARARERWRAWQEKENDKKDRSARLEELLKTWGVKSIEDLELKAQDATNAAIQIRSEWQKLVDARPGLPSPQLAEDWQKLETEFNSLSREINDLRERKKAVEEKIFSANRELNALQGRQVINIAAAKDRIAELSSECERLKLETEALALAYKELAAALDLFSSTHRERLAAAASNYFARMTNSPGRRVALDSEFNVSVFEADGHEVDVSQLSQGAQDQLQVALRLAIADLVAGDYNLPMVFDDPFLNFDSDRLAVLQEALTDLAKERQILVLSHQETYRQWGSPVKWREAACQRE